MQAAPFEGTNKCKFETDDSRTCLGFILEQPDNEGKLMAVVQYRYKKTVRPTQTQRGRTLRIKNLFLDDDPAIAYPCRVTITPVLQLDESRKTPRL